MSAPPTVEQVLRQFKEDLEAFSLDLDSGDDVLAAEKMMDALAYGISFVQGSADLWELDEILAHLAGQNPKLKDADRAARRFRRATKKVSYGHIGIKDLKKVKSCHQELLNYLWVWYESKTA